MRHRKLLHYRIGWPWPWRRRCRCGLRWPCPDTLAPYPYPPAPGPGMNSRPQWDGPTQIVANLSPDRRPERPLLTRGQAARSNGWRQP